MTGTQRNIQVVHSSFGRREYLVQVPFASTKAGKTMSMRICLERRKTYFFFFSFLIYTGNGMEDRPQPRILPTTRTSLRTHINISTPAAHVETVLPLREQPHPTQPPLQQHPTSIHPLPTTELDSTTTTTTTTTTSPTRGQHQMTGNTQTNDNNGEDDTSNSHQQHHQQSSNQQTSPNIKPTIKNGLIKGSTYNIRSGRGERLISAIRSLSYMQMDWTILTETKLTDGIHTRNFPGYQVEATNAKSAHQGGVALAWREGPRHSIESVKRWL
jgi:hypothetical protein